MYIYIYFVYVYIWCIFCIYEYAAFGRPLVGVVSCRYLQLQCFGVGWAPLPLVACMKVALAGFLEWYTIAVHRAAAPEWQLSKTQGLMLCRLNIYDRRPDS